MPPYPSSHLQTFVSTHSPKMHMGSHTEQNVSCIKDVGRGGEGRGRRGVGEEREKIKNHTCVGEREGF